MTQETGDTKGTQTSSDQAEAAQVGFVNLMGLKLVRVAEQEVVAELVVAPQHYQPMGIVHGGVYCSIVETVCSVGAYMHASKRGLFVVGVDNQTSFLKATRSGLLRATARPLSVGRRTHLWEANIHDEQGTLISTGRVRLMSVEPSASLGGEAAGRGSEPPSRG